MYVLRKTTIKSAMVFCVCHSSCGRIIYLNILLEADTLRDRMQNDSRLEFVWTNSELVESFLQRRMRCSEYNIL